MNIYVNGCSHSCGTALSLDNDLTKAWPYLITGSVINDCKQGSSNDRIFRETIEFILSSKIPVDKVVIQFTALDRFDTPNYTHHPRSSYKNAKKFSRFYQTFFGKSEENDKQLSHKLINQIYALQCILLEHGISDWLFISWFALDQSYTTYKHLDKSKLIVEAQEKLFDLGYKHCSLFDTKRNKPDGHFQADAHQQIAEWINSGYSVENQKGIYYPEIENVYT